VLDVLFPADLPETGTSIGFMSILAGVLLLGGVASMTVSSNRRSRRRTRGGK
jgi:LPXTG-motif cell wall-anchored protein